MKMKVVIASWVLTAGLLASGCGPAPTVGKGLRAEEPAQRIRAIGRVVRHNEREKIPLLVDRLDDEDEAVRFYAIAALKQMTGKDLGYRGAEALYRRDRAVARWRTWVKSQAGERK